jgi:hypothetical protein
MIAFILAIVSPFSILIAACILGGLVMLPLLFGFFQRDFHIPSRKKQVIVRRLAAILVFAAPVIVYDLWISTNDPLFAAWNAQNLTPTPPVWDILLAFSPLMLLSLPGAITVVKERNDRGWLFIIWAVMALVMIYLPIGLQRRLLVGYMLPIAGLAVFGIELLTRNRARLRAWIVGLTIILILPTNLLLMTGMVSAVVSKDERFFYSRGEAAAFDWIEQNTPQDALILAAPQTALFIPPHSGRRVLYGHPFETINAESQRTFVEDIFRKGGFAFDLTSFPQLDQIEEIYLFVGLRERALGDWGEISSMQLVFQESEVAVYARPR